MFVVNGPLKQVYSLTYSFYFHSNVIPIFRFGDFDLLA